MSVRKITNYFRVYRCLPLSAVKTPPRRVLKTPLFPSCWCRWHNCTPQRDKEKTGAFVRLLGGLRRGAKLGASAGGRRHTRQSPCRRVGAGPGDGLMDMAAKFIKQGTPIGATAPGQFAGGCSPSAPVAKYVGAVWCCLVLFGAVGCFLVAHKSASSRVEQ